MVGAVQVDNGGTGATYVFRTTDGGDTYGQVAKLTAADAAMYDYFGYSVAIDGNTIVVGAPATVAWDSVNTPGAAYVYRTTDGWASHTEIKLTADDACSPWRRRPSAWPPGRRWRRRRS